MKKYSQLIFNTIILILLAGVCLYVYLSNSKIGYLNFDRLLEKYEGIQPAGQELEARTKIYRDNADTLAAELNRAVKNFETNKKKMAAAERNVRIQELEKQRNDVLRYREAMEGKIREEQEKTIDRFAKEIHEYLNEYSKKNNYSVIFYQQGQFIAYAEEGTDITDQVLKGLNERYRSKNIRK